MATKKTDSWDNEENEVESNWVKFNVSEETAPGAADKVFGTLIGKRQTKSQMQGKEGEMQNVYDLKADMGQFHALDEKKKIIEEPVIIEAGSFWSIGGKPALDAQMRNIKVGQKIGFKFIDEKAAKTKGWNAAKSIRVYAPKNADNTGPLMDEEFMAAQGQGELAAEFDK